MSKQPRYVERRDDGTYAVRKPNSERASIVTDTQREAIDAAKEMTNGPVHVERVRDTNRGSRDKWRRP